MSYSWLVHIWSRILELLLALRVGLLMRGMREFEWQMLIKSFSMTMGSRRLILRSPTMNTWSDCEVDYKISFHFIVDSGNFDVWWSVNSNYNKGRIVWKRNLYHSDLIICKTQWKIGHMGRCVTISDPVLSARYVYESRYNQRYRQWWAR